MSLIPLYFFAFGAFSLVGGVVGFVKAKSRPSLIAGGVSGGLLCLAGWLIQSGRTVPGLVLGGVVSLALAGRFGPAYRKQRKLFPAGLMAMLAVGGLVATALGFTR